MSRSATSLSAHDVLTVEVRVALVSHLGARSCADHLDLFMGPLIAEPDALVARGWRLPLTAWNGSCLLAGSYAAIELPAHRARYLELAAPSELSDHRGVVTPLWTSVAAADMQEHRVTLFLAHHIMRLTRSVNTVDQEHASWNILLEPCP